MTLEDTTSSTQQTSGRSIYPENGYEVVDMEETVETRKSKADRVQQITWIVCLGRADLRSCEQISSRCQPRRRPVIGAPWESMTP